MRPQAGVGKLKHAPPMQASDLPLVAQAVPPANYIFSHLLTVGDRIGAPTGVPSGSGGVWLTGALRSFLFPGAARRNVIKQNRFAYAAYRLVSIQPAEGQIFAAALLGRHPAVVLQHGMADGDPSGDGLVGFEAVPGGEADAGIVAGVEALHVEVRDPAALQLGGEARHILPPIEIGIHQNALGMGAAEFVEIDRKSV